ncbi:hypothetical protein BASA50_006571 [Batrachochytrium salamandrivorans]|uniref:SURF1-like protein n=1 Tax=Batrachochytrium salamandrivorans TaxID=1357716 RepID=A0ABQ8FB48_9FUNG|nr:hypothetical protein BASA61_008326 [Batrachochytrium salamandrivorans]KAH6594621.1 hypothetical protein BASA50_006571 [Batrachochytrium salamandrivorans]KAH9270953.1 hypothetical protein BASA83_006909 [Batrachochytrium salamandrivorans]
MSLLANRRCRVTITSIIRPSYITALYSKITAVSTVPTAFIYSYRPLVTTSVSPTSTKTSATPTSGANASPNVQDLYIHRGRQRGGWLWLVPVITLGLGIWQLRRLQWKTNLIEKAQSRIDLTPYPLSSESARGIVPQRDQFTRVTVTGTFLHDKEILLGPRVFHADTSEDTGGGIIGGGRPNIGFFIFTPFVLSDGAVILVNRGWIPRDERDDPRRKAISGPITIDGVIRDGEPIGYLQSLIISNRPEIGEWHNIDLAHYSRWTDSLPVIVQMISNSQINNQVSSMDGMPLLQKVHAKLRNTHLEYAMTWFGLCGMSTLLLASKKRIFRRR